MIEGIIERLPRWAKSPAEVIYAASKAYGRDRAARMSAAIAYRTVFALAPMLIIAISVAGWFLGSSELAQEELLEGIESIAGPEVAATMATFLASAISSANTAAIIGGILLLWTASSLFIELQHDLNDIFEVPYERISGLLALARKRGLGVLWVFGLGLLMLLILLINTAWGLIATLLPSNLDGLGSLVNVLAPIVSLVVLPFLFGLIFKTLVVAPLPWKAAWGGGLFTAVVFTIAAWGIGLYFELFGATTALGFAGSFVVVLFLAYMLSAVFLFGAEVTSVATERMEKAAEDERRVRSAARLEVPVDPLVVVAEPPRMVPLTAIYAFLGGLLVGWRRRGRRSP
jgi:membrane protein